ncbi:hypothetical protein DSL72_005928 [Monilinia vaccinii-corymbosi]|uniref:Amidoligase enzyme n=1 Tax=Monilinia vaccinii-corymbosi TaxID=61207 RepID=A0A8A3PGE5_9HELO|nr:hypothetical protein DSL72_005928 [Monilinia vaccinii-corymbosi]
MSAHPAPLALTSRDFTFGVEFEFGIRFPERPFKRVVKIWELIRDTLIVETGLQVRTEVEVEMLDTSPMYVNLMGPRKAKPTDDSIPESESFTTWVIGTDCSLEFKGEMEEDNGHEYYCCLEMQSPVLNFGPEALVEIKKVLTALHKHFNAVVNSTCGLHVHVGRGREGISHVPFQHLMATIWVFEPQISELLHRSRETFGYCTPLNDISYLGVRGFEGSLLDLILGTSEVNEVVDMFGGYRNTIGVAYSIENLRQPFMSPMKRTIEFRQHQGCLDPETVMNWVSFVVELVAWAHKIDRQDLKIFLSKYINKKERYSVEDLFREIGFPKSTFDFWRRQVEVLRDAEEKEDERKAKEKGR